jgi:DNA-binding LacI/PurR family transcriptional regulator
MSTPPQPTQQAIANAAGVSRSTVSRALVNDSSISPETRERIHQIAEKLGYRPDPLVAANMLRVRRATEVRTKAMLAYLLPFSLPAKKTNGVVSAQLYFESAKERAEELGFGIDPIPLNDPPISGKRCTEILLARGIQGVLIAPFENPFIRFRFEWRHFAAATIGYALIHPRLSFATNNHYRSINLALRSLHRLGYRKIGFAIPLRADRYADGAFSAGYCLYADAHMSEERIPRLVADTSDWNRTNFLKWYYEHKPDAIVSITDDIRDWLEAEKIYAPADVGLAHLNWNEQKGDWSGINEHNELTGAAAAQLVIDQIMLNMRGIPACPKSVLIDGVWVPGGTVRRHSGAS